MANLFYRERINQHLQIGLEAVRILRDEIGPDQLHSRKLTSPRSGERERRDRNVAENRGDVLAARGAERSQIQG